MTPETATTFLEHLYSDFDTGWLTAFAIDRSTGNKTTLWAPVDTVTRLTEQIADLPEHSCVWFGCATRHRRLPGQRGGAEDCRELPGLWVDLDIAGPAHADGNLPPDQQAAHAILERFPLPPTVVLHSGNGLQAWWALDEPLDTAEAVDVLEQWHATWERLGAPHHVDNVFDVARIMRLPGTTNHKVEPRDVTIINEDWTRRYALGDVVELLDDIPTPMATTTVSQWTGDEGLPGQVYNAQHTGDEILAGLGFTLESSHNGERHYVRPGKRSGASATVYPDGHTTIWSDTVVQMWPSLQVRRPYDPFGLYTCTHHGGDYRAAAAELEVRGIGTLKRNDTTIEDLPGVDHEAVAAGEAPNPLSKYLIDWSTFWTTDHSATDWICEPLFAAGRAHALFAGAKTGKSWITLAACAAVASGKAFLNQPAGPPVDILYVDYEMTPDDLYDRLGQFGYSSDDDLTHLHYALLPSLPPLDTEKGGVALTQAALAVGAQFVIIDTTGRAVAGEENDASTYQAFYRCTGLLLKQQGIGWARLDHAGKDAEKGQRGSSAKNDDVDIVIKLTRKDDGVLVEATHRRIGWYPEKTLIAINEDDHGAISMRTAGDSRGYVEGSFDLARELDELDVPLEWGRNRVRDYLHREGVTATNKVLADAIRWRKHQAEVAAHYAIEDLVTRPEPVDNPQVDTSTDLSEISRTGPVIHRLGQGGGQVNETLENTGSDRSTDRYGQVAPLEDGQTPLSVREGGLDEPAVDLAPTGTDVSKYSIEDLF